MAPAFSSTRSAAAFGAVLVLLLTLPVLLHWIGGVSREEAYRGISENAGSFNYFHQQIFEDHSDVDILFTGGSLLGNGLDFSMVQRALSQALGRQAKVIVLREAWQGPDMNYFVAREFMERRKVKMFVITTPAWVHRSSQPHVQLFRIIRYGDDADALDGLPLRNRMAIYAAYVLGAPRQALNLLRANAIDPPPGEPVFHGSTLGYLGGPFTRHKVVVPDIPPAALIDSPANREVFHFDGPPLNAYQFHFLRKTEELAERQGSLLVILHLPSPSERGSAIVSERQLVPELLKPGVIFAGVPSKRMFEDVPDSQFFDYFQDEHLNVNGSDLYTGIITPLLVQLYEQRFPAR